MSAPAPTGQHRVFDHIFHADWSVAPRGRWVAHARRTEAGTGWHVTAAELVGDTAARLDTALAFSAEARVLMGFDFPIGVPAAYARQTGFASFRDALEAFGTGAWSRFFDVAGTIEEISIQRPFYPMAPRKGMTRQDLVAGLGLTHFDETLRACDRASDAGRAASSMLWTLGGAQVGKAALAGWRDMIRPALLRGARLWPYEGSLAHLGDRPGLVLAESYPALAYRVVGVPFGPADSKRRQFDRLARADRILAWADARSVALAPDAAAQIRDGFGTRRTGEDAFDAMLGLLAMIEIADGRLPEAGAARSEIDRWEGWILGR